MLAFCVSISLSLTHTQTFTHVYTIIPPKKEAEGWGYLSYLLLSALFLSPPNQGCN